MKVQDITEGLVGKILLARQQTAPNKLLHEHLHQTKPWTTPLTLTCCHQPASYPCVALKIGLDQDSVSTGMLHLSIVDTDRRNIHIDTLSTESTKLEFISKASWDEEKFNEGLSNSMYIR